jgi:hypothetical protein
MNTKLIGIREFRQNINDYVKLARGGKYRLVVMNRNNPLFEVKSFKKNSEIADIFSELVTAKDDVKKGKLCSQDEILKEFV